MENATLVPSLHSRFPLGVVGVGVGNFLMERFAALRASDVVVQAPDLADAGHVLRVRGQYPSWRPGTTRSSRMRRTEPQPQRLPLANADSGLLFAASVVRGPTASLRARAVTAGQYKSSLQRFSWGG